MSTHYVQVFISHSWWYSDHYNTLEQWIFQHTWRFGQASVVFRNFSVPKTDPIHNARTDRELRTAIYNQISRSHVVVIPMGMYAKYSKWIGKELDGAVTYAKPILAVNPWGQLRTPSFVGSKAAKRVGWNSQSVVSGIWDLYRGA